LLPSKASYRDRSTGPITTSVGDNALSLRRNLSATAAASGSTPLSRNAANAASTPASLSRAARCKVRTYSLAARSGHRPRKASQAIRKRLRGNKSAW
jgi:hypothetical protein